jgi:hypothetical protein
VSFTYNFTTDPVLSRVRLLIADTDASNYIFEDVEITQALYMESSQALYCSPQSNPTAFPTSSVYIPQVYSPYLAAALLLDSLASNKARIGSITQLLDVKLDPTKASKMFRDIAESYRQREQDMGHFAVAEMVYDQFTTRERILNQWLRLYAN